MPYYSVQGNYSRPTDHVSVILSFLGFAGCCHQNQYAGSYIIGSQHVHNAQAQIK